MAKKIIVVRVGEKETHIVHMEYSNSNPTVYGCVRFPTPENSVRDGMIQDMSELAGRIHKTCADKGIRTKDVIFTISSTRLASREVNIPVVSKAKIQPLVMAKLPDLFPIDQDKYVFSYILQGKPHEDAEGGKIQDVMVYAAPADLIDSYYTLADAAGLHIVSLEADWNAVFQIAKRQKKNEVCMLVQMDQATTLVTIYDSQHLLLQRVIPYGINVFTEAMVQEPVFRTPTEEEAYALLKKNRVLVGNLNAENPGANPSLAKRIEVTDNASALLGNLGRIIEYYNGRYKNQPIGKISCMGQGCAIAGIHELMSNELGIPASTPDEIYGIRFNRSLNINAYILQYMSCFGSVFEPVNFISRALTQRSQKKGALTGAVLIFVGCLLLTVVINGFSVLQWFMTRDENETLHSRVTAMRPIRDEYDSLRVIEFDRLRVDAMELYSTTNNNRFHKLLEEIENKVPKSFKIQNVSSDESHVTISASSTDKLLSLSALQIQLNKIAAIYGVKLDSITQANEAVTRQKQFTYNLVFNYRLSTEAIAKIFSEIQDVSSDGEGTEPTEEEGGQP